MEVKSFFGEHHLNVTHIKYLKKSRTVVFFLELMHFLTESEIEKYEQDLSELLQGYVVVLSVRYLNIIKNEEFWTNYQSNVKEYLFRKYPSLNGMKTNVTIEIDSEQKKLYCCVSQTFLHNNLKNNKLDMVLAEKIQRELGIVMEVSFICNYSEYAIEHYQKQQEDYLEQFIQTMETKIAEAPKEQKTMEAVCMYGKNFSGEAVPLKTIRQAVEKVILEGKVFAFDKRQMKNQKYLYLFNITDQTDSISCKLFLKEDNLQLSDGDFVKILGNVTYDTYAQELVVMVSSMMPSKEEKRFDNCERKRVELHAHTSMSSMEGLLSAKELLGAAKEFGHKAIAITDDAVVQAFPDAMGSAKKTGIKVLYGVEGHLVDDMSNILKEFNDKDLNQEFVVFDIETTGFSSINDAIIEIGAVKIKNREIIDRFSEFVNPKREIPYNITELTSITNEMVCNEDTIEEVLPRFMEFSKGSVFVAHNSDFDTSFIKENCKRLNLLYDRIAIDTVELSRALLTDLKRHKLNVVAKKLGISLENHHRAVDDAEATAQIFLKFLTMIEECGVTTLAEVNQKITKTNIDTIRDKSITIFAQNLVGLKNLYKLISFSHIKHFYRIPRILKSELVEHREGLLIGTGGENGEIFGGVREEVERGVDPSVVDEKIKFYDFAEVMPVSTYRSFFSARFDMNETDLRRINQRIYDAATQAGIMTVAVGNVHYLNPEDGIYRHILRYGQKKKDDRIDQALYYRTTQEMLDEFEYLGKEVAYEIVVKNTNDFADLIEEMLPVPEGTFPPEIEGAKEDLREMCYEKAKRIYGNPLPEIVEKRLDRELSSIIGNGYAVMYIIAQKLVTKSLRDGYLVGSRGSVGSSFAATMSDITEVNPLPPHYICENEDCKYSEFMESGAFGSGVDMPNKLCPCCGRELKKDGFDIPFEVFLGFEGDKEPDIDLNFAGEYQPNAHKFVEDLFGEGYVFRAGTIGTVAEKTAYGYVVKYLEENNLVANNAEKQRLQLGCTGIKRTSGQHPGGVMVCPKNKDIYDFTPVQYPANDTKCGVITTHFDYHSISGRILKLDILGHDVPSIIRHLEDMTNVVATEIPLDDERVMSIFTSTDAIDCDLSQIQCETGTLGIPEFGTRFVQHMLMDTNPHTFAELIRISGLSHGTDVWVNNAQDLVRSNTVTLKDVISTRDDIMNYLIQEGLPSKMSFKIMENVRKGKGLTEEQEECMISHQVPNWYITSCKKIKYMFPKAHAVAYVMMSFRIAYFKVYHKEAFYAACFSTKVDNFDVDLICRGKEAVMMAYQELKQKENNLTAKEMGFITVLELAYEMHQRGVKMNHVDIYKSDSKKFYVLDNEILPPLLSIPGLGLTVAEKIKEEAGKSEFISLEDFRIRTKASKTVIETLRNHGCLQGLPETNQLSLF